MDSHRVGALEEQLIQRPWKGKVAKTLEVLPLWIAI